MLKLMHRIAPNGLTSVWGILLSVMVANKVHGGRYPNQWITGFRPGIAWFDSQQCQKCER